MKKLALLLAFVFPAYADQIAVSKFSGINNNNNPATIDQSQAQDLLNVDITPGGLSVKKRDGYGIYKAFSTGQAMHGGFHAFDSTGNDYQLWGSSTSFYGVVADATPTQLVSSATLNSTWDCADSQGNSYCVNSNRDVYLRTNGTTKTWYTSPLGTMVETTPDRIVVAGVSGNPNTLYVSQSNTFTNFTTGVNDTDAFTEVIASQGSKLTHIRWACGKLLWWKDQSFGFFDFDNQYQAQVKTVSDTIGTFDNTSAVDPGGNVWFRGQDGHTWKYDCSSLSKESIEITTNVQTSGRRSSNLWTQTTQGDFETGVSSRPAALSFTAVSGVVVLSTGTTTYTTSADFSLGTTSNTEVNSNSVRISTNSASYPNPSFETALGADWSVSFGSRVSSLSADGCTQSPQSGSFFYVSNPGSTLTLNVVVELISYDGDTLTSTSFTSSGGGCAWTLRTLSTAGHARKSAFIRIRETNSMGTLFESEKFILNGDNISFYTAPSTQVGGTQYLISFDSFSGGISSINLGWYRTPSYDTGFYKSLLTITTTYTTINQASDSQDISYQSSPNNSTWGAIVFSGLNNQTVDRYVRFISTWTRNPTNGPHLASTLDSVQFTVTSATGTYLSAVKNAPNLTAWSTLGVTSTNNGGTQTFSMRSSTSVFTVQSTTPTWTSQTPGGLVTISTGTYFQFKDDFAVTFTTQTPTLYDFTVNWFEGSAGDQSYMLYFDNAIWQSVAFGAGQSVNNYIFKKDLINDAWTLYNFGAGGLLSQANTLYFGDTSAGNVFNYGTTTSDNGTAINAYWKSKEFAGSDPFLQTQLTNIDTIAKKDQGSTLTATYTTETSSSTAYSISLSSITQTIINNRKLLPSGKLGYTFSMKYGDQSTSSDWELLGFRIGFTQNPYRPSN